MPAPTEEIFRRNGTPVTSTGGNGSPLTAGLTPQAESGSFVDLRPPSFPTPTSADLDSCSSGSGSASYQPIESGHSPSSIERLRDTANRHLRASLKLTDKWCGIRLVFAAGEVATVSILGALYSLAKNIGLGAAHAFDKVNDWVENSQSRYPAESVLQRVGRAAEVVAVCGAGPVPIFGLGVSIVAAETLDALCSVGVRVSHILSGDKGRR